METKMTIHLQSAMLKLKDQSTNLDSQVNPNNHTRAETKSAFYHPGSISKIRGQWINTIHSLLVFSRVDYCDGVFIKKGKMVLGSLHRLPVRQRIYFQLFLLVSQL